MGVPSRFPFGITTDTKDQPFSWYGGGGVNVAKWAAYINDFMTYAAADWTVTNVGTTPTQALTNGNGGLLALATAASASSSTVINKVGEFVLPAAGKRTLFRTRFKVSNVAGANFVLGLTVTDSTPFNASGAGVTDGLFWQSEAGTVKFYCQKDTSTGQTSKGGIATLADDTFTELAFHYDGLSTIELFQDGVQVGHMDLTASPAAFLPDTTLTVALAVQNTASTARTLTIDYVAAAQER